ncbi:CDP-alcohol phosphatidyltransferase family protein [Kitasatospora purpeofusca]|uniref:CDP-alcohol phosphatidyltransferase family protein n=1 Tax=Kitasatospora purpeofusca TaxID=67352 RepID=UPI0036B96002
MAVAAPASAELREVCQPRAKPASRNGERWAGRMYMRAVSLRVTRQLVRTSVSPNTLTWLMVVCGVGAGAALLVPGLPGAVLFQGFLLFDCVDGEVARWKRQFSTAGVYVDRLGAYPADAALMVGAGVRAARGGSELWVSVGLAAALGVVLLKASTDLVDVARARSGLAPADEESTQPRSQGIATARRPASVFKIHRVTNGVEASLVLPAAAVADAVVGSLGPTRAVVAGIAVITWGMVVAHLASILSSSRLR